MKRSGTLGKKTQDLTSPAGAQESNPGRSAPGLEGRYLTSPEGAQGQAAQRAGVPGPSSRHDVDEDRAGVCAVVPSALSGLDSDVIPTPDRGFPSAALRRDYRPLSAYSCQRFGFT